MLGTILVVGGAGLAGLYFWSKRDDPEQVQEGEIWLTPGQQYSLVIYEPEVANTDDLHSMLQSVGFAVESIVLMPPGGMFRVLASWPGQPTLWQVPDNVSIAPL